MTRSHTRPPLVPSSAASEVYKRPHLLSDVPRELSDHQVNILSATVHTTQHRVANLRFTFEMGDTAHLDHIIASLRRVEGVFEVYRLTGAARPRGVSSPPGFAWTLPPLMRVPPPPR